MALSSTCLWAALTDLKPWLNFASSDVQHDAMLEVRANAVTEELERETGRVFVSRSLTETLDGTGHALLYLRGYPVTAIATFTLDGVAVDAADYVLDAAAGILKRTTGVWTAGVGNYAIAYTAGYARASLPASVLTLGAELFRARYLTWSSNADVFSGQQINGVGSFSTPTGGDWITIRKQIDTLRHEYRVGGFA